MVNFTKGTIALMATALASMSIAKVDIVRVNVNGNPVQFLGAQPQEMNGRVMVPLRGVFEELGAWVNWNDATQEVYATKGDKEIRLQIGNPVATVNGADQRMDVPAKLIDGTTLVPLRFISESLGAHVQWDATEDLVSVHTKRNTGHENDLERPVHRAEPIMIEQGTILPIKINRQLSSSFSKQGDDFEGTIVSDTKAFPNLPSGTKILGHVQKATPQQDKEPGLLSLKFDSIMLPNGQKQAIKATLIGLDDKSISRDSRGRLTAELKKEDNRGKYAAYGAGAGLLVGLTSNRTLENSLLGGLLGFVVGSAEKPASHATDVIVKEGSQLGVQITKDLTIERQ